jgi:hypothetical protein
MEYLNEENYTHLDTVNRIDEWSLSDVKVIYLGVCTM